MEKKEARNILGVSKETSKNDIERKYSILLKKHKMAHVPPADEDGQPQDASQGDATAKEAEARQEEYNFEQITQAYNVLMGYETPMKEEPPSKAAPLLKKAGIDEKKARNFFYYYKWHILIAIVIVIVGVFTIRGCVNRVDPDFSIAFIGRFDYSESDTLKEAIRKNIPEITEPGFDGAYVTDDEQGGEQQYAMVMKATVLFAAGDVDIFILDRANYERYAKQGAFISLDEVAAELGVDMEKNKDLILKEETNDESDGKDTVAAPGDTAVEHLYGIDITNSTVLKESGILGTEFIAALRVNGEQTDKAMNVLQFLMK